MDVVQNIWEDKLDDNLYVHTWVGMASERDDCICATLHCHKDNKNDSLLNRKSIGFMETMKKVDVSNKICCWCSLSSATSRFSTQNVSLAV